MVNTSRGRRGRGRALALWWLTVWLFAVGTGWSGEATEGTTHALLINGALQAATAALAAAGYRAERANKHMRVTESLEFTVGLDRSQVRLLDKCRWKRHVAVYEQTGAICAREADEMVELAKELRLKVEDWIRVEHPRLLSS